MFPSNVLPFLMIIGCDAVYNPNNWNPEYADPLHNLSCTGPLPPFKIIPLFHFHTPGSIQSLCAQVQYGGDPAGNYGGFCPLHQVQRYGRISMGERGLSSLPEVSFDRPAGDDEVRVLAYCKLRCVCSGVGEDQRVPNTVKNMFHEAMPNPFHALPVTFIPLERLQDQWARLIDSVNRRRGRQRCMEASTFQFRDVPKDRLDPKGRERFHDDWKMARTILYTIDDANHIVCDDVWPADFELPTPARRQDFEHLSEICAVALSGGNVASNAGAFCHQNAVPCEWDDADVWFSDEMTPLKEWTWDWYQYTTYSPLHPRPVLLRRHCWRHCRCADPRYRLRRKNRIMERIWPLLEGEVAQLNLPSSMSLDEDEPKQQDAITSQSTTGPLTQACSSWFSPGWCSRNAAALPIIFQHLLPSPYIDITLPPVVTDATGPSTSCHQECSSAGQCKALSSDTCIYKGPCAVDPSSLTQTVVGSLGHVLKIYTLALCVRRHIRPKDLHRRSVDDSTDTVEEKDDENMDLKRWPCACNSTYISDACCHSNNGVIWEGTQFYLGGLET